MFRNSWAFAQADYFCCVSGWGGSVSQGFGIGCWVAMALRGVTLKVAGLGR